MRADLSSAAGVSANSRVIDRAASAALSLRNRRSRRVAKMPSTARPAMTAKGDCQPNRAISSPASGTPISHEPAHDSSVIPSARPRRS